MTLATEFTPPHIEHSAPEQEDLEATLPEGETSSILERHPDWPKLDVSFYFSPHGNKKDFEGVPSRIADADIYLYENGSSSVSDFLQNEVADHPEQSVEELVQRTGIDGKPVKGTAWEPIIRGLYDTEKAVGLIDIPSDKSELHIPYYELTQEGIPLKDTFKESASALGTTLVSEMAALQHEREHIMAEEFEKELERLLEERPELRDKPELNVLITMGSYHTTLRHKLTEAGVPSTREFSTPYQTFGYRDELQRTYAYDRQPTEELLERAWIETVFTTAIKNTLQDYEDSSDALGLHIRNTISKLDGKQRHKIYKIIDKTRSLSDDTITDIDNFLQKNGIGRLPRNSEEVLSPRELQRKQRSLARRALSALSPKRFRG